MEEKKPLVIILSRNYSTGLSVIRSVGAAGYTVDLVASAYKKGNSKVAACSKYVRRHVEVVSAKVKEDGEDNELINALLKYAGESGFKPVLFPTDDYTTSVMDQNRTLLGEYFIMPTIVGGGDGCLTERMDKTVQAQMAKKAGLMTPREWIFSLSQKIHIPSDMVYPCFVKPIESVSGYKREMAVCCNEQELHDHLAALRGVFSRRSILVQEYLNIDYEIDLSGVCLDQEIIIPAVIKKTNVAKYERGVTLAGRVVPLDEIAEIKENVINMLKQFHYFGMFDMELNVVGDKIYFNEVNLRSGGPNYAYFMSGVNLPALFVKEALGERHTPEEERVREYGKSFIYEKVAWEDHIHGFMNKKQLNAWIKAADITLLCNEDDPAPGRCFQRSIRKSVFVAKLRAKKRGFGKWKRKVRKSLSKFKQRVRRFMAPLRKIKYTLLGYPQAKKENIANPFSEKPRVVVAGRNYCSNLCMARSIGKAGYEVEVLRVFQVKPKLTNVMKILKPDAYSKYVKAYHVCIAQRKSQRIVKKLIQIADGYRKMLLIPADDLVANIADEFYDELSAYYFIPNVNRQAGEINRLMSKEEQKKLAEAFGLPVLNSCVIRTSYGYFEIPESVKYPCFVKPNISKNSSKSRMRKCRSEEELRAVLTEFSENKDIEMLVEDYVHIDREYSLLGVSTGNGVVAPGFFVAEEGGHDERRGVAMTGVLLPCEQEQKLIDEIVKFIGTLNYEGLFDVDMIRTSSGKMYFVELNLRYGASGYAVTESGANLPGMFADYMVFKKPINLNCSIEEPGKHFISEKVMLEEYMKGYLTMPELKQHMADADIHFVMDETDTKPYRHFKKFYWIASLMRKFFMLKMRKKA